MTVGEAAYTRAESGLGLGWRKVYVDPEQVQRPR